jgi:hypothetical protein
MPFLFALYIVAFLDRVNISFAGLDMTREPGFSGRVFGFGAGIFFLATSCSKFRVRCWWSCGARANGSPRS